MKGMSCCHMAGIPDWLYYSSIVIIMLVSFLILEIYKRRRTPRQGYWKLELTQSKALKKLIRSRGVQLVLQLLVVALFLLIIYAGFYGNQMPGENIAPVLTWNIWWIGLIFIILVSGKLWCYMCPWDLITNLATRINPFKVTRVTLNLGLKWPKFLKNIYLATALFIFLTWLELGYHVTLDPEFTAVLGMLMLALVFVPGLIFEKKSFCQFGCLVGRISGLYAMFSPVEVRSKERSVCAGCKTMDCFHGNDQGYPCPTNQNLKTMESNTYCTMCAECFRSCPHDNVAFNIRNFGTDLFKLTKFKKDESYLALILFSLTAFHGLTMTPRWDWFILLLKDTLHINELAAFSLGMLLCLAAPVLVYQVFVYCSKLFAGEKKITMSDLFVKFAYGLLPIALFYHLAHNVEHFFMEGQKLVVLSSDPFGYGWNLFGTANATYDSILSLETVWYIQVLLIIIGHVFGIVVTHKHSYLIFDTNKAALRSQLPMIFLMVVFSVLSLWLVAQPMQMRTGM